MLQKIKITTTTNVASRQFYFLFVFGFDPSLQVGDVLYLYPEARTDVWHSSCRVQAHAYLDVRLLQNILNIFLYALFC